MARIFWDSNVFIYLFEDDPRWADEVAGHYRRLRARGDRLFTAWLTVGEVLAKPIQIGDTMLERRYRSFFGSDAVTMLPFDREAADRYARLRATSRVRPADAMQLACAAAAGMDLFVSNDRRLQSLSVSGVAFVTGLDRVP